MAEEAAGIGGEVNEDRGRDLGRHQPGAGSERGDPGLPVLRFVSLVESPQLATTAAAIERDVGPILAELTRAHRDRATERHPATSWVVFEDELPVGVVRAVPWGWSGASGDAPSGGVGEVAAGVDALAVDEADTLAVLDVLVAFGARGRGIGREILRQLDARRAEQRLDRLLVLVRPHAKRDYPLVPFQRYVSFMRDDGAPFDPWLRATWQQGMVPIALAERSLSARAPFGAWQRWLGVEVPGSGPYLIDGALKPAILETELDEGRYREPHVWVGRGSGVPEASGWVEALGAAGIVAGDRAHREVKRRR